MANDSTDGTNWRTTPTRRPTSFGRTRHDPDQPKPPTMSRSRVQIAGAYAPGVLMTWEGGKGICRSVPLENDISKHLNRTTVDLIFESMRDLVTNWRERISTVLPDTVTELALDSSFRNSKTGEVHVDRSNFQMTGPDKVGYVPYPLLYRCGVCGSTREFQSLDEQASRPLPRKCHNHTARWTQVDVVYVHWSGELQPLSPFNFNFDSKSDQVRQIRLCTCGSANFKLRNESPTFSEWRYVCEGCGDRRPLKKAAPGALERLELEHRKTGQTFQYLEVNMLPVSYRANSTFYPQRTSFIEFDDSAVVDLMTENRSGELIRKLAQIHDIPFDEPTDADIESEVTKDASRASEWEDYQTFLKMADRNQNDGYPERSRRYRGEAADIREGWFSAGLLERGRLDSRAILQAVTDRQDWTRNYDPIRLTVQHNAFQSEHIDEAKKQHRAVDVLEPDITLTDVSNDPVKLKRYQASVGKLLDHLGFENLVLIRGLPICEFSFGYTRVSATPIYKREHNGASFDMPVRLNAFDPLPVQGNKRPIYITQQRNEALYFKLDEARVIRWLKANLVDDVPVFNLGRAYLERYSDFGPFLETFKNREGGGDITRSVPTYVYLLLHSLSHQMMHSLADTSGVDRDGIGEHIFPADLSFVIYRKGMTPDLGNISAMWRNNAEEFLRRAIDPRMLRCGSGNLCDVRGGACPACVMVSEVSCVASNLLLSRAALKGGAGPEWEPKSAPDLVGYFDVSLSK